MRYVSCKYFDGWFTDVSSPGQSMNLGRPPSVSLSYVDCEFPEDDGATINNKGEVEMGCKASRTICVPIIELAFSFPFQVFFYKRRIHTGARTYTHSDTTDLRDHFGTGPESSGEGPPSFTEFIPLQL